MKIIKLTEEQIKILEGSKKAVDTARNFFEEAGSMLSIRKDELWARIKEMFPEEKTIKEYLLETHELVVSED